MQVYNSKLTESETIRLYDGCIKQANKMIGEACLEAYNNAQINRSGKRYKTRQPYTVPDWCEDMLAVIQREDEHEIKAAMQAARSGCYTLIN